jgi:hypothetical protein
MIVRRVEPASLARVMGSIYAILGLVIALPMGCVATVVPTDEFGTFGLGLVILYPIIMGVAGYLGGLLSAVIYNFIAGRFGGIEIQVEETVAPAGAFD